MSRSPGKTTLQLGALSLSLLLLGAACSKPSAPDKDRPPTPKVETQTQLRDAIQAPIDRAKAVSPAVLDAAQKQRDDIDAQIDGGAPTPPPQ